jgi:prepilin peptidase CpaA
VLLNLWQFGWRGLLISAGGLGIALLIYVPLYALRGMAAGDVKLMAAIGVLVGWSKWLTIFVLTGILGGLAAIVLVIWDRRLRRTFANIGHALADLARGRAPYARTEEMDVSTAKGLCLPHGAVIMLGSLLALGLDRLSR